MKAKYLIVVIFLLGVFIKSEAQSLTKIKKDSLMTIWADINQHDTLRLKAINQISKEGFRFENPDSSLYYAKLQYEFATTIKNKNYQTLALNVQGDSYLLKGEPDKALEVLNKALIISKELSSKKNIINTLGNLTRVLDTKGELDKALNYNLQILELSEELQDKEGIGKSLSNIGNRYVKKGDFPKGFEYLNRSKKIFEELDNPYNVVKVQAFIAQIYMQQGNLDKALELVQLNLAYFEETGNKTLMAGSLSNLGGIYAKKGDNKKALEYLERAMVYIEASGNIPYIAGLSQNLGFMHFDEGNHGRALEYLKKSLKLSKQIKNETYIAAAKKKIGIILSSQGNYSEAIKISNEALKFYQGTEDVRSIQMTSANLINSYKASGNYKKALEMNELFHQMRDSLSNKENQKALIELQVQSDYDKQKAIDDLENEKEVAIATQKTKAQRNISIAIGAVLLLISLLAFVIFNRLKVTRAQKRIIEEQKKKVEQSEKYKEQFLANMSHEIRTPMHAISGMVKILKRNEHPSSQNIFLNAMHTSSDNLVVILNDVLDLSKIEAGKLDIESIPMSPTSVIENVIQILKFKAEEKGLQLNYQVDDEVPSLLMGDPTRLNQILINLVGNAIKFTGKGNVNILLQKENDRLKFSVKDTGIGISPNKVGSIFGAFEQAKDSISRHYGGTGLGLSISKQLVELQQGKIWVESEEDKGSTFFFELPFIAAAANAVSENLITEERLKSMTDSLQGIRILLAEDNAFNQMIAQDDLSFFIKDVKIDVVENGMQAVEKFQQGNYDLILMDVQMPEMNGFEATREIRDLEKSESREKAIPIIAMTASLLKSEIESCRQAGMDNYIPKPYQPEELIAPIYKEMNK